MEHKSKSSSSPKMHAKAGPATSMSQAYRDLRTSHIGRHNNGKPPPPAPQQVQEQDQYMPIANVIRIMRRILPPQAKISDDAKETVQECVSEYISFITGEANDRCQREQRKTITAEDILWAMGKLGFDDYVGPLSLYLSHYREIETDRSPLRCEAPTFLRQAGSAMDFRHGVIGFSDYHLNNPCSNNIMGNIAMGPANYHPPMAVLLGEYYYGDEPGTSGSGSNGASASVSASQDALADFGPYAQFK